MRQRIATSGFAALLVASLLANLWQANRIHGLMATVQQPAAVALGTIVPTLHGFDADDHPVEVSFTDKTEPTILYIFRAGCEWCARNRQRANILAERSHGRAAFIAVSLLRHGLDGEAVVAPAGATAILFSPDAQFSRELALGPTPQTILIGTNARILANWLGAYNGDVAGQIASQLGIVFPAMPASTDRK